MGRVIPIANKQKTKMESELHIRYINFTMDELHKFNRNLRVTNR